jgi:hypothetical protein
MQEIYLSWSRLRSHEECKQKGYLERAKKKLAIDDHRNFLPGNITDRIVRDWLLDDPNENLGKMPEMVSEYFDKSVKESKDQGGVILWRGAEVTDRDQILKDCTEAVTEIEKYLQKYVIPFDYTPDFAFKVPLQVNLKNREPVTVVLNGYMDILVKHSESNYFIFDVKHTKDNYYWKKTIGQLAFYDTSLMLLEKHPSKIAALLQPLCKNQLHQFEITNLDRQKMWQSISNYAEDVVNNNNEPTTNVSACSMCRVKHACIKFEPKMVNGKRKVTL